MPESDTAQAGFWLILESHLARKLLLIEPYGVGWQMEPGESFYVYMAETGGHLPEVHFSEESIQVFASLAVVYLNGEKIFDFYDTPVQPPF